MDKVDQIIDSSQSEEEAISRIKKLASDLHGADNVNGIIDGSPDEETAITHLKNLARNAPATKEDKNLSQIYEGFKKLGYLAKPFTTLATPITEAVRAVPKYIAENVGQNTSQTPPIDTAAEFKSWEPSDRAGTSLFLQDVNNAVGIKNQPLLNVHSKDYPKAAAMINHVSTPANAGGIALDTVLGAGKIPYVKGTDVRIPGTNVNPGIALMDTVGEGASALNKGVRAATPQPVANFANGVIEDVGNSVSGLKRALSREQMVKNYLKATSKDKQLYQDLADSGKIKEVEAIMNQDDSLIQPFNKEAVLDRLDGPIQSVIDPETGLESPRRQTNQGEIGQRTAQNDQIIEEIPRNGDKGFNTSRVDISTRAKGLLKEKGLDSNQVIAAEKIIDDVTKVIPFDQNKISLINQVNDANAKIPDAAQAIADEVERIITGKGEQIKKQTARLDGIDPILDNPDYKPGQNNEPQTLPNEKYNLIEADITEKVTAINDEIAQLQSGNISDPSKYNKLAKLIKDKKALEDFYYNNLDDSALSVDQYKELIQQRNIEPIGFANKIRKRGNVYKSSFNPNESPLDISAREQAGNVLEQAGYEELSNGLGQLPKDKRVLFDQTNKDISNKINLRDLMSRHRSTEDGGPNVPVGGWIKGTAREAISLKDEYGMPYLHKAASAIKRAGITYGTQGAKMAGVNLQSYLIPRTSEEIMQNPDLVADKINMELGPKGVKMFQEAMKSPQMLAQALRQMEMAKPGMFQADEYGRFDGQISDPVLKQKAIENIINNQPSAIEGAKQMQLLINGNKYYGG